MSEENKLDVADKVEATIVPAQSGDQEKEEATIVPAQSGDQEKEKEEAHAEVKGAGATSIDPDADLDPTHALLGAKAKVSELHSAIHNTGGVDSFVTREIALIYHDLGLFLRKITPRF